MPDEITAAIQDSIADHPDASPDPAVPETPVEASDSGAAPEQTAPDGTPADAAAPAKPLAMPEGEERPKRRYPIPLERHEAALAKARADGEATATQVRQQYEQQVQQLQRRAELLDVADRDPERFFRALIAADPRYAQLIEREIAAKATNGNGQAQADAMPQPDAQFADGSIGYSPEGLEKYMAWRERQIEHRIMERYKPIEDKFLGEQQVQAAMSRVQVQVQEAMQWDGFEQNQAEIGEALKADRRLTLEGAYRKVVFPKMKADKDKIRADLIAELNAKPKKVTGTAPTGGAVPAASSDDLTSIIKAAIAAHPDR